MRLTHSGKPQEAPTVGPSPKGLDETLPEATRVLVGVPQSPEFKATANPAVAQAFARGVATAGMVEKAIAGITDLEKSGGNCGAFAIALANAIGRHRCQFALSSAEWDLDQPSFGHVGVRLDGKILDGSGLVTEDELNVWAQDEALDAEVHYVPATEDIDRWILNGTDPECDIREFQARIESALR